VEIRRLPVEEDGFYEKLGFEPLRRRMRIEVEDL
jgi:hypothetical protein